jgi:UDP-N-acetylglucosamine 4,6-dehydratase
MSSWLVTGGTGSLGNALVRRLLADATVERIAVVSRDELKQARMAEALGHDADLDGGRVRFFLGDVRDLQRMELAMHGVDVVVAAAALKRVDSIAYNPSEVIQTNVMGGWNTYIAALHAGVRRVVAVGSDKGCLPSTPYGGSKYLAETLAVNCNTYGAPRGTTYTALRYGNVAGSRGSVIHLWRRAVAEGRPLALTDARMTRFWLTLDEACDLVLFAASDAVQPGEVVVPKLPGFLVEDLAKAIGGYSYPRVSTGRRSGGEKLHELLLAEPEVNLTADMGAYYAVQPDPHPWTRTLPNTDKCSLSEGFIYSSDTAPRLTMGRLCELLNAVPDETP